MISIKGKITFTEEVLGTASANKEIHETFIASNAPDAPSRKEEVEALGAEEVEKKEMTVFPRDEEGNPIFWDYQIKGFFKDSCGALKKVTGTACSKIAAYKKKIDGTLFVNPRMIRINMPAGTEIGSCQRPLRGQTAQGERIALANSETIPAGSWCEIEIVLLDDSMKKMVMECLEYGKLKGIGQWRNSGKGKFIFELEEESKEDFDLSKVC